MHYVVHTYCYHCKFQDVVKDQDEKPRNEYRFLEEDSGRESFGMGVEQWS